ncbi:MAG TPA: FHA domain-containing protein [Kofleriaceae bacterium]|nr:FHA domain-containing protein [Kofleriaceae bacterium]
MLRVVVSEQGADSLPPVDVDGDFVIGSAADAKIRLPASEAKPEHVRVVAADIGDGQTFEIGRYHVRVAPAPAGAVAASPQRTESLARELVRGLLGGNAAPTLEIERGPHAGAGGDRRGAKRTLAPPESTLVIGRGDDAGWILDDEDLSRAHAEVRRGWDGVWVRDLDSKNGTRVDGAAIRGETALHDGALVELGPVALRFRDPAERHLRGATPSPSSSPSPVSALVRPRNPFIFFAALAVMVLALAGIAWVLAS